VDIGSGPTVGDATTCADALAVLERHGVAIPRAAREALVRGEWESVKAGDPRLARAEFRLVATPQASLEAAARVAAHGDSPPSSRTLEGEAREVGRNMADLARRTLAEAACGSACLLLSAARPGNRAGRRLRGATSSSCSPSGWRSSCAQVHALAGDTDGVDGMARSRVRCAAGHPGAAAAAGLDPAGSLARNDAHSFFAALGDAIVTARRSPTSTTSARAGAAVPAG